MKYYVPNPRVDVEPFASQSVPDIDCEIDGVVVDDRRLSDPAPLSPLEPVVLRLYKVRLRMDCFIVSTTVPVVADLLLRPLQDVCGGDVDFVEAVVQGYSGRWWIMHLRRVIDCLNQSAVEEIHAHKGYRKLRPIEYPDADLVFKEPMLRGVSAFRFPEEMSRTVLSEEVMEVLKSVPLCGIEFAAVRTSN